MTTEQNFDAEGHQLNGTQLTYADLLTHVRETRKRELEASSPGRASNVNAVSNTTRALTLFMESNCLTDKDVVGPELLDESTFELSLRNLTGQKDSVRRRRSELTKNVRTCALSIIKVHMQSDENSTLSDRLVQLLSQAGISRNELVKAVSQSGKKQHSVYTWISGKSIPTPKHFPVVCKIADFFGVPHSYLLDVIPENRRYSQSKTTGLPASLQRRVSKHLPNDFDILEDDVKEEILHWVSDNILSTPKEVLENGGETSGSVGADVSYYCLSRDNKSRAPKAPYHFILQLDQVQNFKTAKLLPRGMNRNSSWGPAAAERGDYYLRSVPGALHAMGMPLDASTLCFCLFPDVIDKFIAWKVDRRGGYTRNISDPLIIIESLLHPETGFITQSPNLRDNIKEVSGFFSRQDVDRIISSSDDEWRSICASSRDHISQRIKEINSISEKGRDPFEAILPVLKTENPLKEYHKIVDEIRLRMPGQEYPLSRAEAMRSLMIIRIGLASGFRSKNMRQLLFTTDSPKTWKELKRLKRGELSFDGDNWVIRIPGSAFKNETSRAVDEENIIVIHNNDSLYDEIENYILERHKLLGNHKDSGAFFVKTVSSRSKDSEYSRNAYYEAFRATITTYGIYNPYTGKGAIEGLRPHGPHSIRHILATTLVKHTGGFSDAAAFLMDTEDMVRENYARFLPGERHARAQSILLQSMGDK